MMDVIANFVELDPADPKARALISNSLAGNALGRWLAGRWAAGGALAAIFDSGVDLALLGSYDDVWPVPPDEGFRYPGATAETTHARMAAD